MKIGEIFIELGFKLTGKKDFDDVAPSVERTTLQATKLAVAINGIVTGMVIMMDTAARAGQALINFDRTTGLSGQQLQFWQHAGATVGVTADTITASFKRLQDTKASFALGNPENAGIWSMLGVDPRQDPVSVIMALRSRLKTVSPANMGTVRSLVDQLGLGGLLPLLRSTNEEFEKWQRTFILTGQQTERLGKLNAAWQSLLMSVTAVKNLFVAAVAPAFEKLSKWLERVVGVIAIFVRWMGQSSTAATIVRRTIEALLLLVVALGAGLLGLTLALAGLSGIMIALSPAIIGFAAELFPIALVLGVIAAAIVGVILILQDFETAVNGGKSFLNWNNGLIMTIGNVNRLAKAIEWVLTLNDRLTHSIPGSVRAGMADNSTAVARAAAEARQLQASQVHVDAKVIVNGANSPSDTAREIGKSLGAHIRAATSQAPAYSR